MFHKMLEEATDITLTSSWKEAKKVIKEDPRYSKFSSSDRVSRQYSDAVEISLLIKAGLRLDLETDNKSGLPHQE